jgi:hypothetical protein
VRQSKVAAGKGGEKADLITVTGEEGRERKRDKK